MIDITRLLSAALIAAMLAMPGTAAADEGAGAATWWDTVRAGTVGVVNYGVDAVRSLAGWFSGGVLGRDESKAEDVRGLLNLSDKEFREFDAQIRAAGYVLQGYSFGLGGGSDVELVFDFERMIGERERGELRHQLDQQGTVANAVRRSVILGLLDATRYIDASPASGYHLGGVVMRLGSPLDVRVQFRRIKP